MDGTVPHDIGYLGTRSDSSTRRCHNMTQSRRHLALVDLMAAVVAAALGLGWVVWVAPGRAVPMLIVIGPLTGILSDRWRGGRGIIGGALGGAAYAGVGLIMLVTGPHGPGRLGSRRSRTGLFNWSS